MRFKLPSIPPTAPADQAERDKACFERARNVLVDAGAGTGKTTLLVRRVLHLIAPEDDGPAVSLARIAAITFTRRAAGELRLRVREALLAALAREPLSDTRRERLQAARDSLDNAHIGTIHSFADRLLRLQPAAAGISPDYDIVDQPDDLASETFRVLVDAAETETLAHALEGSVAAVHAAEAQAIVLDLVRAGLRQRSHDVSEFYSETGLDQLVAELIGSRDRQLTLPEVPAPDLTGVRKAAAELSAELAPVSGEGRGFRILERIGRRAAELETETDPVRALRTILKIRATPKLGKKADFDNDAAAWNATKWLFEGKRMKPKAERPGGPLLDDLLTPLSAWMGARLIRLRPVVLELYRRVKIRHRVVDQLDLLVRLRDVLQDDVIARFALQGRFDHILVDEFQDTDPLQAEIILYLCEQGVRATRRHDVKLTPGKLTVVGDPKQSIYRFRRADVAMYDDVCRIIRAGGACTAELTVNFRSRPPLIDWLNQGFRKVLGEPDAPDQHFDPDTGTVFARDLEAGRTGGPAAVVHVLPVRAEGTKAEDFRPVEGEALAHYLRWLVEDSGHEIEDPETGKPRRVSYRDIAVLAITTPNLGHLTHWLDELTIPHVIRGGTLFAQDPLHRQFFLGLRALADRDDGIALAALMRPPFFAIGLDDLLRDRHKLGESDAIAAAKERIRALRQQRHQQPPGATARDLLEQTGLAASVAAMPNGEQRLARLYEICLRFETRARTGGLDYDAVSAELRGFIDHPPSLEAPLPLDADAVHVMTVHQAKGLEWPVVALWDGRAGWPSYLRPTSLHVDSDQDAFALSVTPLKHDSSGQDLIARERRFRNQERRRVVYVAATRARDLLLVPECGEPSEKTIAGTLLLHTPGHAVERLAIYRDPDAEPWWESQRGVTVRPPADLIDDVETKWAHAAAQAASARLAPAAVSSAAQYVLAAALEDDPEDPPAPPKPTESRHGPVFGDAVHRAMELILGEAMDPADAVETACHQVGWTIATEVARDVQRALSALRELDLVGPDHALLRDDVVYRPEFPLAGSLEPTRLLGGYIDLLARKDGTLYVLDYKTDQPPKGEVGDSHPKYVAQVQAYGELLIGAGVTGGGGVRAGLLFTGDGAVRWV